MEWDIGDKVAGVEVVAGVDDEGEHYFLVRREDGGDIQLNDDAASELGSLILGMVDSGGDIVFSADGRVFSAVPNIPWRNN